MTESMDRDEQRRYARAVWFAVDEKNVTLETADEFADWWCRVGWLSHSTIAAGFQEWARGTAPRFNES
jgi:hypothetical protein